MVVLGDCSARGMELVTRVVGRRAGGGLGGRGVVWEGAFWAAASSQAARAEGSIGQAEEGGSVGGGWGVVEGVFPMVVSRVGDEVTVKIGERDQMEKVIDVRGPGITLAPLGGRGPRKSESGVSGGMLGQLDQCYITKSNIRPCHLLMVFSVQSCFILHHGRPEDLPREYDRSSEYRRDQVHPPYQTNSFPRLFSNP